MSIKGIEKWTPELGGPTILYLCATCLGERCDYCKDDKPEMIVRSTRAVIGTWVNGKYINEPVISEPFKRTNEHVFSKDHKLTVQYRLCKPTQSYDPLNNYPSSHPSRDDTDPEIKEGYVCVMCHGLRSPCNYCIDGKANRIMTAKWIPRVGRACGTWEFGEPFKRTDETIFRR